MTFNRQPQRARKRNLGFTLIELIVVIFIIIVLAVILIVVILQAMSNEGKGGTINLIQVTQSALNKYADERGGSYPGSDITPSQNDIDGENWLEGNQVLAQTLLKYADRSDIDPYLRYWVDGKVAAEGDDVDAIIVDGWGTPVIYWEWASARRVRGASDIPGESLNEVGRKMPDWVSPEDKGNYSIWSAGADLTWDTEDDIGPGGEEVQDRPFD